MNGNEDRREAALSRVKAKRDFRNHAAIYVVVNVMLIGIWALSGAGYFWPIWAILGWGIGLAFNAWSAYFEKPITEDDIRREMAKSG
ncbi:MAG: 2TM domain-containing protein [Acidimicrobiia bacterium]|nr:2TM domain-containing protein [Acidimicrobiia bacterium]